MPLDCERVAVMVIRAWVESGGRAEPLWVRVTITHDVLGQSRETATRVFADADAVCAEVRRFLEELRNGPAAVPDLRARPHGS